MSELQAFCRAMDGEWKVEERESQPDGRVKVTYRSLLDPTITWSHVAYRGQKLAPVGTVGRIAFYWGS